MPEPVDLPAIRAEGRRLLAEAREINWPPDLPRTEALNKWLVRHADVLLADPTPGDRLTEADLSWVTDIKTVDAVDSTVVDAMAANDGWRLLHVGVGVAGQTTLTFAWPAHRLTEAPTLTEEDRESVERAADYAATGIDASPYLTDRLLAIIDRLSGSGEQHDG